jgi:hypothetical protein
MQCEIENKTNSFLDLNGVPYLVGEYVDRESFRQIDRSHINSEVNVIEEDMKAIVEISIDDIGKRPSDGYLQIIGNSTKQKRLVKIIRKHAHRFEHRLDVLRKGIIVLISYQLENNRTGRIIRSSQETIRINDKNYFIDVNPRNVDDNAIVVNFYDNIVSTINQFTHGTDHMIIRITNIQLFYECTKRDFMRSPYGEDPYHPGYPVPLYHHHDGPYHPNDDYYYQLENQNNSNRDIYPPSWNMYNRFYHFANRGKAIELHINEIYDVNTRIFLLPCGNMKLNRTFFVRPAHRIVFKINIWKNDVVIVNDTRMIAESLEDRTIDWSGCDVNVDHRQDREIERIWDAINSMNDHDCEPDYRPNRPPYRPEYPSDCCDHDRNNLFFIPFRRHEIRRMVDMIFRD